MAGTAIVSTRLPGGNQRRIILRLQLRRQVVDLQRRRVIDRHEVKAIVLDLRGEFRRGPLHRDHGVDFAFA